MKQVNVGKVIIRFLFTKEILKQFPKNFIGITTSFEGRLFTRQLNESDVERLKEKEMDGGFIEYKGIRIPDFHIEKIEGFYYPYYEEV
jgi:hypothetical protein